MNRHARLSVFAFLLPVLLLLGCSLDDDDDVLPGLEITVEADGDTTFANDPVTLTVTARNLGDERIVWGHGSSACQLHAIVIDGLRALQAVELRACTDDVVPQALDPGESRAESWEWAGEVVDGIDTRSLELGRYPVRGVAGVRSSSNTVQVDVVLTVASNW